MKQRPPTAVDLFCGCGGFSLGLHKAGFETLAAIDADEHAISVYRHNFPNVEHVLKKNLLEFSPTELAALIGTDTVDVIIGGPPCQGFSNVRKRDGSNHGTKVVDDSRRHLYKEFLRFVEFFMPRVFIMENVLGIRTAAGGEYFRRVQSEAREFGYRVHGKIVKAAEYGVPQKRHRQLIFGTRLDQLDFFRDSLMPTTHTEENFVTLGEALGDLPIVRAGGGAKERDYDLGKRAAHVERYGDAYLNGVIEVQRVAKLTAHEARPHSARDLGDFARLHEGESSAQAMRRGIKFDFPYDTSHFGDRYTRQHRDDLCSTIVAHLSKDGLMFIHPTQTRSLTPREAARVQSFPDWFEFPVSRTHQFRLIGNAVPPLVGKAVGEAVKTYLRNVDESERRKIVKFEIEPLPSNDKQALQSLMLLVHAADSRTLRRVSADNFKRGWYSIGFLYSGLHPDSALEHGTETADDFEDWPEVRRIDPRLIGPNYVQSGWPVVLEPVAKEAWRRFDAGEMSESEFYCIEAVIAGMCHRDPDLMQQVRQERTKVSA